MQQEVRVLPHDAIRLVTVAMANKQNLNHGPLNASQGDVLPRFAHPENRTFLPEIRVNPANRGKSRQWMVVKW